MTGKAVPDPVVGESLRDYLVRVVPHLPTCGTRPLLTGGARAKCHCDGVTHETRLASLRRWHEVNP